MDNLTLTLIIFHKMETEKNALKDTYILVVTSHHVPVRDLVADAVSGLAGVGIPVAFARRTARGPRAPSSTLAPQQTPIPTCGCQVWSLTQFFHVGS